MKNRMKRMVLSVLLFSMVLSISAGALDMKQFSAETAKKAGADWEGEGAINHPGSLEYWRIRTIVEQSWRGENRPQPLMGDANIDGKVNATDALFALYFSIFGNEQTYQVAEYVKTPYILRKEGEIYGFCLEGKADVLQASPEFWWLYCRMNSPFFADVTKDCVVNAKDALEILKYSVGKAKNFPENDFSSLVPTYFLYYPWPTEYSLGMFG